MGNRSWHFCRMRSQAGLSIVEIMVALTIGLFIIGGILYVFVSSRTVFSTNDAIARIQEDGRITMEILAREIRQAGFIGCANTQVVTPNVIADASPHDGVPDVVFTAGDGIRVFDNGMDGATAWVNPTTISRIAGTDVIQIKGMGTCSAKLTGNMTADNANIQIGTNPCGWAAGQVLLVADCTNIDVFVASNVSVGSVTIAHASNVNIDPKLSKAYGSEAVVYGYGEKTYFVGMNPTINQPMLYEINYNGSATTVNDVVGNVYDLQVLSAQLDSDGNLAPDVNTQAAGNPPSFAAAVNWQQALGMSIRFSVRSESDNTGTESLTYTFNGGPVTDRRIKRDFISSVGIRNRLP